MSPEMTERKWKILHGALLVGHLLERGYIEGGGFVVNYEKVQADILLIDAVESYERPSDEEIVFCAMGLMRARDGMDPEVEDAMLGICEHEVGSLTL